MKIFVALASLFILVSDCKLQSRLALMFEDSKDSREVSLAKIAKREAVYQY